MPGARSWDATDTSGDPAGALARLVASSWQLVHQFRNILLAAQRELPAERIRGVHDRILRRVQSLIEQGQRAGTFRRDMPQQWLITTTYSLMHAAAEDAAAGRLDADDAAGLITATLLAAFTRTRADDPARSARISSERAVVSASAAEVLPVHGQLLAPAELLQARGEQILDPPQALPVGCSARTVSPPGKACMVHWPQSRLTVPSVPEHSTRRTSGATSPRA